MTELFLLFLIGFFLWGIFRDRDLNRTADPEWLLAASRLGMSLGDDVMHGTVADCDVTLRCESRSDGEGNRNTVYTCLEVRPAGPPTIPLDLHIGRKASTFFEKLLVKPDSRVDDPVFDSAFRLEGDEVLLVGALSETTRERLFHSPFTVEGGRLTCETTRALTHAEEIVRLVRRATELVSALRLAPEEVPAALAANALSDSLPAVRRNNFRLLAQQFPTHPVTREAAVKAVDHKDSHLRLAAARLLQGETGRHCLEQLVRASAVETSVRTNALRALVEDHGYSQVAKTVREFLFLRDDPVVVASAARLAGQYRDKHALEQLYALSKAEGDLAQAVAEALGKLEDPGATPVLLEFLMRTSPELQKAAASSLGRVGTVEAVEPLLALAQKSWLSGDLQQSAEEAARLIQSRSGAVSGGELALVHERGEAGGLSLPAASGGMSLADEESPSPNSAGTKVKSQ